jgi:hypothetical protein
MSYTLTVSPPRRTVSVLALRLAVNVSPSAGMLDRAANTSEMIGIRRSSDTGLASRRTDRRIRRRRGVDSFWIGMFTLCVHPLHEQMWR